MKTYFPKLLLGWYDKNKRKLPWRLKKSDPYKTWISEMMLQQTQVDTVLPYFQKFLKSFPTIQDLAEAPVEEVLKLWSGLGYYSRARNLHASAQHIVNNLEGIFPDTREKLLELKGIGEYSAGAIASIAFGERVPVVDGNVIRVLTRVHALAGDPKTKLLKEKLWKLAALLVPAGRPGDFNQAMMELGALVCSSKEPRCPVCPLRKMCRAHLQNRVGAFPTPKEKLPAEKVFLQAALIEKDGAYLLAKRGNQKHLQSMWEFPQMAPRKLQIKAGLKAALPVVRHSIMNRRIQLIPHLYKYVGGRPKPNRQYVAYRWISPKDLQNFPTSSINHKICSIIC